MISDNVFVYNWTHTDSTEDDENGMRISICGLDEKNENVYIKIDDYFAECYAELPTVINNHFFNWDDNIHYLLSKLNTIGKSDFRPLEKKLVYKTRLYGAHLDKNPKYREGEKEKKYTHKKFPYLYLTFSNEKAMKYYKRCVEKEFRVPIIGEMKLKLHQVDGTPSFIKLMAKRHLPSVGWVKIRGKNSIEKITSCTKEYSVSYKDIFPDPSNKKNVKPLIMTIDTEENSSGWRTNAMPNANNKEDKVFQISVVLSRNLTYNPVKNKYIKCLFTLGDPDPIENVFVYKYDREDQLLLGFKDFIKKKKPNIILGYNLYDWDLKYMMDRSKYLDIFTQFITNTYIDGKASNIPRESDNGSKAYGKFKKPPLESDGIIYIDLLPLVQRRYSLIDYRLNTVAEFFGVGEKDPLTPQDIFRCYREFSGKSLALVGKYCVQDSYVTLLIFERMTVWISLTKEASTNHVPLLYLVSRGQQVKMYSQACEYCSDENKIVEKNPFPTNINEHYTGAIVLEAKKGVHDNVISEDFASLYPSIIIAQNIDYSTLVTDENIPDEDCNVFEWEEHINCEHDKVFMENEEKKRKRQENIMKNKAKRELKKENIAVTEEYIQKRIKEMNKIKNKLNSINNHFGIEENDIIKPPAIDKDLKEVQIDFSSNNKDDKEELKLAKKVRICAKFKYRFIKEELCEKGVIPTLIERLLDARKSTRLRIAEIEKEIEELENGKINDKDEKAIKQYIDDLKMEILILDKQQLEYKVSANSMYGAMGVREGYLPFLPGAMCVTYNGRKAIARAVELVKSKGGDVIYGDTDSCMAKFKGKSNQELFKIGKEIAEESKSIFKKPMKLEFENKIYRKFILLSKKRYAAQACDINGKIDPKLIIKGVQLKRRDGMKIMRELYEYLLKSVFNDVGIHTMVDKICDDILSMFQRKYPNEYFLIIKTLKKMPNEYKTKPATAYIAEKLISRGQQVFINSRLGYFLTTMGGNKYNVKQYEKIEEEEYFTNNKEFFRLDFLYILQKGIMKPIGDLLKIIIPWYENLLVEQYQYHKNKEECIKSLKQYFELDVEFTESRIMKKGKEEIKQVKKNEEKKKEIDISFE